MAVKTFEEIYSGLSAQEKTVIDNLFAREPELKGGWLRQDDYSRKQNELKSKQTEYEAAVEYRTRIEPWVNTTTTQIDELEQAGVIDSEGKIIWTDTKAELEKQLEAAKALGGDMDPKVLDELVTKKVQEIAKQAGGLTREEAAALYASESKKLVDAGFTEREEKFNKETIPFVAGFSSGVAVVASHYEQESGEKWTTEKAKELFKLMGDEQNFDALKIEEKFLAPVREKKKTESEIEKKAQERADAILKERGITAGMPGGGNERIIPQTPADNPVGLLQKAMAESAGKAEVDVRDSVLAGVVEGAKELIAAGKV